MLLYSAPQIFGKAAAPTIIEPPASADSSTDQLDHEVSERPKRDLHVAFSPDLLGEENANYNNISDAFEVTESPAIDDGVEVEITRSSIELDVLPIELVSLTDR